MRKLYYLLAILTLLSPIATADISDGLIGYWPFNGNANDASGNGHDGTVYGANLTFDKSGEPNSAYLFDGNDYINIQDDPAFTLGDNDFTLATWVNMSSYGLDGGYYLSHPVLFF